MKYQLLLLGAFIAIVSAQFDCKATTVGLLTTALVNPKTGPLNGISSMGPDVQFTIQTTSSINVQMHLYGDHSLIGIDEHDVGVNGRTIGNPSKVVDFSQTSLDSGLTSLKFYPPVASVVVKMNYDPAWLNISAPTIIVYTQNLTRVACYDIEALAPIRTDGSDNSFAYRGVTLNSNTIGYVFFQGPSMVYWDITFDTAAPPVRQVSDSPSASTPGSSLGSSASRGVIASIIMPLLLVFLYLF